MTDDAKTEPRDLPPVKKDFNEAARGKEPPAPMPPALNLNPPGPLGPGMASRTRGDAARPQVSPALRDLGTDNGQGNEDRSKGRSPDPSLKRVFNKEARKGLYKSVFNTKSRDDGKDLGR